MAATNAVIGARIRQLREGAGRRAQDLAAAIGLDPSAMSNIETGKRSVKTSELTAIAEALGVSPLAVLDEHSLLARLPTAVRTDGGVCSDRSVLDRLRHFAELHEVLADGGVLASTAIGDVPTVDETSWKDSADRLAAWATERLGRPQGPDHFNWLADAIQAELSVDVVVENHTDGSIAGAAITDWSFPLLFVRADQPRPRGLFSLAHELGHLLARDDDTFTIDHDLRAHDDRERLANAFAATYLMPAHLVDDAVTSHGIGPGSLASLLVDLGVSYQSLVYRLHNLGYIDFMIRNQLENLGMRGTIAQVDDPDLARMLLARIAEERSGLEPRPPVRLAYRALQGFHDGVVSIAPVADLIGVDADELLDLLAPQDADPDALQPSETHGSDLQERYAGSPV